MDRIAAAAVRGLQASEREHVIEMLDDLLNYLN